MIEAPGKTELERHMGDAGKAIDENHSHEGPDQKPANEPVGITDKVKEAASDLYEAAAKNARKQDPEADRQVRQAAASVSETIENDPLAALLVAAAVGYALGWIIHGRR